MRDLPRNQEVPLSTYQQFQIPRAADAGLFHKLLLGLSYRDYEICAEGVPAAFGTTAESWLSQQLHYDLAKAEAKRRSLRVEKLAAA